MSRGARELGQFLTVGYLGIAWSGQPSWDIYPAPLVDASILALGTRAGSVKLFRYAYAPLSCPRLHSPRFERGGKSEGAVSLIGEVKLCENWITSIAWSPWLVHDGGQCIYIFLPWNGR